jgi:hypothetical protein
MIVKASNKTDRLRPVVPSAVEPKQLWQRLLPAVQQQYVNPMVTVELIAAPCDII